jgi:hypothetical protein
LQPAGSHGWPISFSKRKGEDQSLNQLYLFEAVKVHVPLLGLERSRTFFLFQVLYKKNVKRVVSFVFSRQLLSPLIRLVLIFKAKKKMSYLIFLCDERLEYKRINVKQQQLYIVLI